MTYQLTRDDVKALRMAHNVSFHAIPNKDRTAMVGTIRCTIKETKFGKDVEFEHEIPTSVSLRQFHHDTNDRALEDNNWSGFDMIHSAQYSEEWTTIARHIVKIGDRLTLHFMRGGWCTQFLQGVNIVADTLYLVINRDKADLFFIVGHYIGEDNTARMTKRH